MLTEDRIVKVAGRTFSPGEQAVVAEIVAKGLDVSRTQLMVRTCEQLDWRRPSGA